MTYLIIGTVICLVALGLMMSEISTETSYLGMILLVIGVTLGLKGRKALDKLMGKKDK